MKDRKKRKLKRTLMFLGGAGVGATSAALVVYACWPRIKSTLEKKLNERNDRVRPAIQEAKDRKAAIAAEKKKLQKELKKFEKAERKTRQKQATRVYNEYLRKGYEPTADMIHEAAGSMLELRKENDEKRDELQKASDAKVEERIAKKKEDREKEAIEHAQEKQSIKLKDGKTLTVSSTVRPENLK